MTTETTPAAGGAVNAADAVQSTSADTTDKVQQTQTEGKAPETSPSQPDAEKPVETDEQRQKRRDRISERIGRYAQRAKEAEARERRLQAEIQELRKPTATDTQNLDYDQREELRIAEALRKRDLAQASRGIRETASERQVAAQETVISMIDDARDRFPDLPDKITKINLSQRTVDYLARQELGVEIAQHLVTHPDLADRLYELTDPKFVTAESLVEAGELMADLKAKISRPAARKVTTAPNPGTTLNGATTPTATSLAELAKGDDASAYIRAREAQWKSGAR